MEGSEAADLMVRESIQITEASVKLLAAGSKNLAAFLLALARDNKKLMGKTNMARLLKERREIKVFRIKGADLKSFNALAKKYGILYAAVKDKRRNDGIIDLITNVDCVSQVNHIMERMGYIAPAKDQEGDAPKKADPRAQPGNSSPERGSGSNPSKMETRTTDEKPSVKGRLAALRAASEDMRSEGKAPQRSRPQSPKTR
ncbi:MAG: PcfB family protein [Oscillospiraceae bacterium]|nr:PcfB family protein [Oscillospiraceae bacterium]